MERKSSRHPSKVAVFTLQRRRGRRDAGRRVVKASNICNHAKASMVVRMFDVVNACESEATDARISQVEEECFVRLDLDQDCKYTHYAAAGVAYGLEILMGIDALGDPAVAVDEIVERLQTIQGAKRLYRYTREVIRAIDPHLYSTAEIKDCGDIETKVTRRLLSMRGLD